MMKLSKKAVLSLTLAPAVLAFGLTTACGRVASDTSAVKVTNGVVIKETAFPSTVLLVLQLPQGEGLCTGTFVNDRQVVTAGHCVEGLDASNPSVYYATQKDGQMAAIAKAVTFERNPQYSIDKGVSEFDVSIITFPAGTAPATTPIAASAPAIGTPFTIVGYGNNANYTDNTGVLSGDGAGVKRKGSNTIQAVQDGMLAFGGLTGKETGADLPKPGTLVSSGEGDSGGPMLVDGKLVGVTSGGGLSKADDGVTDVSVSLYADLNLPANKAFLATAIKDKASSAAQPVYTAGARN